MTESDAATRQWQRVVAVAARLFDERGPDVSMDVIAEEAGVGIGMLARHFPTRAALVRAIEQGSGPPDPVGTQSSSRGSAVNTRRTLFVVTMEPLDGFEDKLNRWYDEEHFPERLSIPGFLSGRRLKSSAPGPAKYLALYELSGPEVLDSEPYHALSTPPSPWTREVRQNVRITREVYVDITPERPDGINPRRPADEL